MPRAFLLLSAASLFLAACAGPPPTTTDGIEVYRISSVSKNRVQFRMLDAVNALRQTSGLPAVELSGQLNAAAETHSRDMSIQNRPWHFGSDGSSPIGRAQRAGYGGQLIYENISESFETELETLAAWMEKPDTREVVLNPDVRDMGFGWHQEAGGKIWWTMVMGG